MKQAARRRGAAVALGVGDAGHTRFSPAAAAQAASVLGLDYPGVLQNVLVALLTAPMPIVPPFLAAVH